MKIKSLSFSLFLTALATFLFSCADDTEDVNFNYSFQSDVSNEFDSLELVFNYTRAYGLMSDGDTAIISVSLEPNSFVLNLKEDNQVIPLGNSAMYAANYEKLIGYNFSIGQGNLYRGDQAIVLESYEYYESTFSEFELQPSLGESYNITFKLDIDQSLTLLENGNYKFFPKFQIMYE